MKNSLILLIIIVIVGCQSKRESKNATETNSISIDEIINANTKALGGAEKIDNVNTIKITSIKWESNYNDSIEFVADRKGRMRIDIYDLKSKDKERVFSESYDGARGYQWSPGTGQEAASENGTVALSHTPQYPGHILQLEDMNSAGHDIQLIDSEYISDTLYYLIELTLSDGFKSYYYVDSNTFLISKIRSKRALHVDIDPNEQFIEVQHFDHKKINGITKPFKVIETDITTDSVLMESFILQYILNPTVDDIFYNDLTKTFR